MLNFRFWMLDAGFSTVDSRFSCGNSGFGLRPKGEAKGSGIWFDPDGSGFRRCLNID